MTLSEYSILVDFTWKIGIFLGFMGGVIWAIHKYWLKNQFMTKAEFASLQVEFENRIEKKIDDGFKPINEQIKKTESLDREFAVFKAKYEGDSALIKEQMSHANEFHKQILHRVNNIASQDLKAMIKDAIHDMK